mmetsp:Transcript_13491/g.31945  ORF Transcript_13491/g.31945 Transcript_13491/m.31945 type:complete len:268 (+) Transcript_13491:114-917(+)
MKNPDTTLIKFFGCHSIQVYTMTMYFLVMENVFLTKLTIHERYDLKGSRINRNAAKVAMGKKARCRHCMEDFIVGDKAQCRHRPNKVHEPNTVLKDNDVNFRCLLTPEDAKKMTDQLTADVHFLRDMEIMDYSLLLGVHRGQHVLPPVDAQPDKPFHRQHNGGLQPALVEGPGYYFFGIIDILQQWNMAKKLERFAKVFLKCQPADGISACEPVLYCDRFERHVISEVIGGVDPFNVSVMSSPPPDDDDASALLVSPKRDIELGAKA